MTDDQSVVKYEGNSPADLASHILKFGGNLDNLEKMIELQERHEANQARKAFHKAMAEFKSNPPEIVKNQLVKYKKKDGSVTEYKHARLGDIASAIGSSLGKYGLHATWKTEQEDKIKVTCFITHELGHSESTSLSADPDPSGSKNPIQAIASTVSYLERYTLLAITGLAANDQDDDGKGADTPPEKPKLTGLNKQNWEFAKKAYFRSGNFDEINKHADVSEEIKSKLIHECATEIYLRDGDFAAMDGFVDVTTELQTKIINEVVE